MCSSPKAFPFSKSWISRDIEPVSRCKLGSMGAGFWAGISYDGEIESSILISMWMSWSSCCAGCIVVGVEFAAGWFPRSCARSALAAFWVFASC